MNSFETSIKISEKLIKNNYEVYQINIHCNSGEIKAKKNYADISVNFETCVCHGGRISIYNNHTESYFRIEHDEYIDGYDTPEKELLYEIENEMMPIINLMYNKMTYKTVNTHYLYLDEKDFGEALQSISKYTNYYSNADSAFYSITGGYFENENAVSFIEGTIDYPNELCHEKISACKEGDIPEKYKRLFDYLGTDKNTKYFKHEYTDDGWKTSRVFYSFISEFNKR